MSFDGFCLLDSDPPRITLGERKRMRMAVVSPDTQCEQHRVMAFADPAVAGLANDAMLEALWVWKVGDAVATKNPGHSRNVARMVD